jgi:DNA polymerase-3 subunit beta
MNAKINKASLLEAIQFVGEFCDTLSLPGGFPKSIRLLIRENEILLEGATRFAGAQITLECEGAGSEKCLLPLEVFQEILKRSSDESVEIIFEENDLVVKGTNFSTIIQKLDDQMSTFPEPTSCSWIEVPGNALGKGLRNVSFASDKDKFSNLSCVHLELDENGITFVATDGFRVAKHRYNQALKVQDNLYLSIDADTVKSLEKCLATIDGNLSIGIDNLSQPTKLIIKWANGYVVSTLMTSNYPDWKAVIPETFTTIISFTGEFSRAVKSAKVLASRESRWIGLSVTDKNVVIKSESETGKSKTELTPVIKGGNTEIAFDYRFLMIDPLNDENISLQMNAGNSPALFTNSDPGWSMVVMPMVER